MGGNFLVGLSFEGPNRGYPPQKKICQILFPHIDRKSKKNSALYVEPFGRERCSKKVWANLPPPPWLIGLINIILDLMSSLRESTYVQVWPWHSVTEKCAYTKKPKWIRITRHQNCLLVYVVCCTPQYLYSPPVEKCVLGSWSQHPACAGILS